MVSTTLSKRGATSFKNPSKNKSFVTYLKKVGVKDVYCQKMY